MFRAFLIIQTGCKPVRLVAKAPVTFVMSIPLSFCLSVHPSACISAATCWKKFRCI
jgi:hypothetical protein